MTSRERAAAALAQVQLDLAEAKERIKALDTLVQAMGQRVNDHERRLRAREGKPK